MGVVHAVRSAASLRWRSRSQSGGLWKRAARSPTVLTCRCCFAPVAPSPSAAYVASVGDLEGLGDLAGLQRLIVRPGEQAFRPGRDQHLWMEARPRSSAASGRAAAVRASPYRVRGDRGTDGTWQRDDRRQLPQQALQDGEFGGEGLVGGRFPGGERLLEQGLGSQGRQSQRGTQRVDAGLVGDGMPRRRAVDLGAPFGDAERVGRLGQEPGRDPVLRRRRGDQRQDLADLQAVQGQEDAVRGEHSLVADLFPAGPAAQGTARRRQVLERLAPALGGVADASGLLRRARLTDPPPGVVHPRGPLLQARLDLLRQHPGRGAAGGWVTGAGADAEPDANANADSDSNADSNADSDADSGIAEQGSLVGDMGGGRRAAPCWTTPHPP